MHQAKNSLSHLVKRAAAGETILIGAYGKAEAKLVSVNDTPPHPNRLGLMNRLIACREILPASFCFIPTAIFVLWLFCAICVPVLQLPYRFPLF